MVLPELGIMLDGIPKTYALLPLEGEGWPKQGGFAVLLPARQVATPPALKVQDERVACCEAQALRKLHRQGVVSLLDAFDCGPSVLVLPWLDAVDYASLRRGSLDGILKFARTAACIIADVHDVGVAHGDIKPDAFMQDPVTRRVVLTDFNAATSTHALLHPLRDPMTEEWVLEDPPHNRGCDYDQFGMAAVGAWLLGVTGFGIAHITHDAALQAVRREVSAARAGGGARLLLLRGVRNVLRMRASLRTAWQQPTRQARAECHNGRPPLGRATLGQHRGSSANVNSAAREQKSAL